MLGGMDRAAPSLADTDLRMLAPTLHSLAERGIVRRHRKGTVLIEEGAQGDTLYLLLRGRVKAFSTDARGREIIYGVYGPGEYLGEMSLDGGPRSASVMTLEATTCVLITRQTLREHIAAQPEFAFELLAKVIRRARAATLSARQLALNDVYGRLVALLEQNGEPLGDGSRRVRRMTHLEMSQRLGCSREMVSRLMKDLERGGYLVPSGAAWVLTRSLPARW